MPVVTKQIELQLSPFDIFAAIKQLTLDEVSQLRSMFDSTIEYDTEHNLPKSFVQELKAGLYQVQQGDVEPFDFSVTES